MDQHKRIINLTPEELSNIIRAHFRLRGDRKVEYLIKHNLVDAPGMPMHTFGGVKIEFDIDGEPPADA